MSCTEILKARVSSEVKLQAKAIADRDLLTEAAWLKRLVIREIRACDAANDAGRELARADDLGRPSREMRARRGCCKPVFVRFRDEDRLLLDARAEARGMRPATYVSALTRSHLRSLTPLPKGGVPGAQAQHWGTGIHRPEHQSNCEGIERRREGAGVRDDGDRLQGRIGKALLGDWDVDIDEVRRQSKLAATNGRQPPKIVHKLMFSMPAGTLSDKVLGAVRNLAREEFWGQHRYTFTLHTDEDRKRVAMARLR
jgi:hypothetical protein